MKTNLTFRTLKLSTFIPLAIAVTAIVTHSIRAATIVITENSSTSLTVVENGVTLPSSDVQNFGADVWTVTLPTAGNSPLLSGEFLAWTEPGATGASSVNTLDWGSSTLISITSDMPLPPGILASPVSPNGTTISVLNNTYTFNDNGDAPITVPDTGSSIGLLALALAGLFGAKRVRSFPLA